MSESNPLLCCSDPACVFCDGTGVVRCDPQPPALRMVLENVPPLPPELLAPCAALLGAAIFFFGEVKALVESHPARDTLTGDWASYYAAATILSAWHRRIEGDNAARNRKENR